MNVVGKKIALAGKNIRVKIREDRLKLLAARGHKVGELK